MKKSIILATMAAMASALVNASPCSTENGVMIYDAARTYALTISAVNKKGKVMLPRKISSSGKQFTGKVKDFVKGSKNPSNVFRVYIDDPDETDLRGYIIDSKPARVFLTYEGGKWVYFKLNDSAPKVMEYFDYDANKNNSRITVTKQTSSCKSAPMTFFVIDVGYSMKNNISIKEMNADDFGTLLKKDKVDVKLQSSMSKSMKDFMNANIEEK